MPGDRPNPQPAEVQELIRQLRLASARAIRIMRNPPGRSDRSRSFNSSHAAAQLAQFDRELKALEHRAVNIASKTVRRAYDQGVKDAEKMARDIGVSAGPIRGGFSQVETRRAKVLVRDTANDIGNAVRSIGTNTRAIVKKTHALNLDPREVDRLMAGETLQGKAPQSLRELRKMVRAAAIDGKLVTINPRTGEARSFKPDFYADLVFQTKLAEATNIATLERLREKKIGYVRIIGSNSTNFCTAFVGKVYYIGEGKDPGGDYPNITELPRGGAPFHPRCTKRYVAFVPGLATQKQKDEGKPTPETERLHGESPTEAQRRFESSSEKPKPSSPPPAPLAPSAALTNQSPDALPAPAPIVRFKQPIELIDLPKTGEVSKQARSTLELIGKIHKMPESAVKIPLKVVGRARYDGVCAISRETRLPTVIHIRKSARHIPTTVAHEFGHYVDNQVFSNKTSEFPLNAFENPVLEQWSDAVLSSHSFQLLAYNASRPGIHPRLKEHLDYLIQPWECFARSYAQWIGVRSRDPGIVANILSEAEAMIPRQWPSAEFEPIAAGLESAMRKAGLLE